MEKLIGGKLSDISLSWSDIFDASHNGIVIINSDGVILLWEELSTMIKAVTGLELTQESLKSIARIISDGTRRFNLQEGLTPLEDRLPKRFTTEAMPETGKIITEDQMRLPENFGLNCLIQSSDLASNHSTCSPWRLG